MDEPAALRFGSLGERADLSAGLGGARGEHDPEVPARPARHQPHPHHVRKLLHRLRHLLRGIVNTLVERRKGCVQHRGNVLIHLNFDSKVLVKHEIVATVQTLVKLKSCLNHQHPVQTKHEVSPAQGELDFCFNGHNFPVQPRSS